MATKPKQKLGPLQKKWLRALESGKFRRTTEVLSQQGCFCCLGVACVVLGVTKTTGIFGEILFDGQSESLSKKVYQKLGLRGATGDFESKETLPDAKGQGCLAQLNDETNIGFKGIAAFCRKYPEVVFMTPK